MELVNGFWWPEEDKECKRAVFHTVSDIDRAIVLCEGRKLAFQAGGNCGVWPCYLAKHFEKVITCEPDETNFECLLKNKTPNTEPIMAALGSKHGSVDLEREPGNIGAHYVKGEGKIPQITIDDFDLKECDLICLDIEGMEYEALMGAKNTLEKFRPVIMVEDKGLSEKYGTPKGWSDNFPGYRVVARINRDVILFPNA